MLGATGLTSVMMVVQKGISIQSSLVVLITALVVWIWFGTYYTIDEDKLIVHCGPVKRTYDISKFEMLRDTHNPLSAPALSLDRIEIRGEGIYILISPANKKSFVDHLMRLNKGIKYM